VFSKFLWKWKGFYRIYCRSLGVRTILAEKGLIPHIIFEIAFAERSSECEG
jgi:hypothetical protein